MNCKAINKFSVLNSLVAYLFLCVCTIRKMMKSRIENIQRVVLNKNIYYGFLYVGCNDDVVRD